jgi:U6 snRNA-associated Sm-like protein LSm8
MVVTNDGRILVGILKGFDQLTNLILKDTEQRIFPISEGNEEAEAEAEIVQLGVLLIRGDTVSIIAEIDLEKDKATNWHGIKATKALVLPWFAGH